MKSRQEKAYFTEKTSVKITEKEFAMTALGVGLWNNMMEPVGQKQPYHFTEIPEAQCPSQEHPYFFTYKNSNYSSFPMELLIESKQQQMSFGSRVPCTDRRPSGRIPTSVHKLKPGDIKVIGALGDSLTAGNGAGSGRLNVLDVLTQYRGLSWSVGGNENINTVTTLANVLREFNPSLRGFSTGKGTETTANAYLNQAVAGARSEGVPSQARRLIELMKNDSNINFNNDWKIITIFIGGNDLCDHCKDLVKHSPQNYINNIKTALDILHKEVPRAFVNLVSILHITVLRKLYQETKVYCPRTITRTLCSCVLTPADGSSATDVMEAFNKRYQEGTHNLINSGRYDTKEDFTVIVQPFLEETEMPMTPDGLPDSSYFAPDCFHFQQKAHSQAARGLWNNMLEPVGEKTKLRSIVPEITLKCPTKTQPYLMTYKNSRTISDHGSQLLCYDKTASINSPTSVHSLKPADVKVVAALGDSFTAGNGVGYTSKNIMGMNIQYRGLSWSIGGDATLQSVTTLPNILREFNTHLTGYSTSTGGPNVANAFLNRAVTEAKARDLPEQAKQLVKLMKSDSRINIYTDWKVITIFIGVNDLCEYCRNVNLYSAANFASYVKEALDILYAEVPKVFVNLVDVMDPLPLRQLFQDTRLSCPGYLADALCICVLPIKEGSAVMVTMKEAIKAYQHSLQKLVASNMYDSREDFTVVLQPSIQLTELPRLPDGQLDISFFAPDCFHLSQKSHSQLARALWNDMLRPLDEKNISVSLVDKITLSCPTLLQPFFGTSKNSIRPSPDPTNEPIENWGSDLLCSKPAPSKSIPKSVHKLEPADIKVVAALGDSFTSAAGVKATDLNDLQITWRGLSWSSGSDGNLEMHTTLPNILKMFNPELTGFSTGTKKETAGFNVAEDGAVAQNLPSQAHELIKRMKSSLNIDYKKDWKLVTILIGANDLCQYCYDKDTYSVEKYVQHIQDTLDIFYKELPRVFVNMVQIMELTGLRQIDRGASGCVLSGASLCPCFFNPAENTVELQEMQWTNKIYQDKTAMLILGDRYEKREDFAVVVQPFFQKTIMPRTTDWKPDLSFFAVDCFHFSERGHAEMAIALWNNMLEPVGDKQTYNNFTYGRKRLKCPTPEQPFFFTSKNSKTKSPENEAGSHSDGVALWSVIVAAVVGTAIGTCLGWLWRIRQRQRSTSTSHTTAL
nr:phospholipase B1, membrane-associated [Anolis sagrei ordinatus]